MEPSVSVHDSVSVRPDHDDVLTAYVQALHALTRLLERQHLPTRLSRLFRPAPRPDQAVLVVDTSPVDSASQDEINPRGKKPFSRQIEETLSQALIQRDALALALSKGEVALTSDNLIRIADCDRKLRKAGEDAFDCRWIPLSTWRSLQTQEAGDRWRLPDSEQWWWNLDKIRFGSARSRRLSVRSIFWTALALATLVLSLNAVVQTANTLASFFLRIFVRVNAEQFGLDIITVLTVVAQILFSSRLSVVYSDRVTNAINQTVKRWNFLGLSYVRQIVVRALPITQLFVGMAMFLIITGFVGNIALVSLADQIRASVSEVNQPLDSSRSAVESAALLDPDVDYPIDLTRLGIRYEEIGDIEQAIQLYEQALGSASTMVITAYRLAELYIEMGPEDTARQNAALRTLDLALIALDNPRLDAKALGLAHEGQRPQIKLLLLVSRGKVFYNQNQLEGALFDLHEAEWITRTHPELFYLPNTMNPEPAENAEQPDDPDPVAPIRIPELYYLLAKTYDAQFGRTHDDAVQNRAAIYWNNVLQLADARLGRERLWVIEAQPGNRR